MLLMLKAATLTKSLSVPALQVLRIDPRRLMSELLHVLNV
jgi:hypothetical protein